MSHPDQGRAQVRLIVSGRVRGVCFRASATNYARKLGLTGFARNLPSGTDEIVAEGSRASLQLFEKWAHQGTSDFFDALLADSRAHGLAGWAYGR